MKEACTGKVGVEETREPEEKSTEGGILWIQGNWSPLVLHGRQVWPSWVGKEEQEVCYLRGAKDPF